MSVFDVCFMSKLWAFLIPLCTYFLAPHDDNARTANASCVTFFFYFRCPTRVPKIFTLDTSDWARHNNRASVVAIEFAQELNGLRRGRTRDTSA